MSTSKPTVHLIGYGNPGRLDDGLGPAVAEYFENEEFEGFSVDSDYQLTVEDSDAISKHDVVIFVDADVAGPEPFWFGEVTPKKDQSFSSHSISPQAVLDLSIDMLGGHAKGYILGIRGYDFNEFEEKLSKKATSNLNDAIAFLKKALDERAFDDYVVKYDKPLKAAQ